MKLLLSIQLIFLASFSYGQTKYEKDFNEFWTDVNNNYAYFDQQKIDWNKVREIYTPLVKQVTNNNDFIRFMETMLNEFHNGHISLNTNLNSSNKIIPSGQDMFVQKQNDRFFVKDLRKGFGADLSGIKIGDEVTFFNNEPIPEQIKKFLPKYTESHTKEMYEYALNMLFAGTHNVKRKITINRNGKQFYFFPDELQPQEERSLIETKILNKTTAYIKFNNSIGDLKVIAEFDNAVDEFINYKNIIIDLTETPSGGNTTIARCIMGRFISKTMPYQLHEADEKEFQTQRKWVEYVIPRKAEFKGNLFVIVGHWTGSMGEGIAIGFDGLERAKVIGTEMAKLLGAIEGFTMTETKIGFQIPTERLYHINGMPRENFKPKIPTQNIDETIKEMNKID
ncbi:S41 family peptidase [Flavobacterium sp. 25HG05S-40]|uniref:S41 family peptidase n=1 Tax=Flavobacterium sp. 25HG05S-40 TaxID=3458682 RepID=UPI0040443EE4